MATALIEQVEQGVVTPVNRDVRTLADVRDRLLASDEASTKQVKLQLSAINTVARISGCAPDDLPADPAQLRGHLAAISPAMAGLTHGSWCSVRSRILKALQRAEVPVMSSRRMAPLSDEWASLHQLLPRDGSWAYLGRLISYLSFRKVGPHEVSDDVIARFARDLETGSLSRRPSSVVRAAVRGWNAAANKVPGWPQQRLSARPAARTAYVFHAEAFPAGFQASLTAYISFLADPPEDDNAPPVALRASTLAMREFQLRQAASALVHQGVPISEVDCIAVLARRDNVTRICEFYSERMGRPDCSAILGFLAVLRPFVRYHLEDADLVNWISRRLRRLGGRRFGVTERNRRRLAVFRDPKHVRDLLLLPFRLLKRAETGGLKPRNAAMLMRAAVAIEIEVMFPIRLANLSGINLETDFIRSRAGKKASVNLVIPGHRTKSGEEIEFEVPAQSMALIDLYIAKYRNELIKPEHRGQKPRFLFPRADGTAMSGKVLAGITCDMLMRELGIHFNMHLFRHLGCYLYLRSHPGEMDVMRRVLGHQDGETTRKFYAFVEQSDAFRVFDAHVLGIREEALRPGRGSRTSKGTRR
jgi:integrase